MKYIFLFLLFFLFQISFSQSNEKANLIIRCDDVGMCHAVNVATKQMIETGIPFSASVMFACPWYQEAVEILKNQPHVAIGVHLTLGSEWKNYRWGPISGRSVVPSLVDSNGYFYPTPNDLMSRKPSIKEIETEFRAQIERALATGLKIDYLDNHMGAGRYDEQQKKLVEKLAKEYKLAVSGTFQEERAGDFSKLAFENQKEALITTVQSLKSGKTYLMVFHLGLQGLEMDALHDSNASGVKQMSRQRETELQMLTSPEFKKAVTDTVKPTNYSSLSKAR
jgi:chitin disaccharide deacetylase